MYALLFYSSSHLFGVLGLLSLCIPILLQGMHIAQPVFHDYEVWIVD